jgi:ABC-type uncharacterized transport system ATPase subunit
VILYTQRKTEVSPASQKFSFTDIAVKELPMEKIITQIYKESNNEQVPKN